MHNEDTPRALIERAQAATGLTQAQLAERLGVGLSTLESWITAGTSRRGMSAPVRELLHRIVEEHGAAQ